MATWVCATCGPVPAGAIRHLDHDSPHGHEQHECGSSAGLDWTTKEHDMTTTSITDEQLEAFARRDIRLVIESHCLEAALQSEVLYDEFPEACDDADEGGWEQLIKRYDTIVRRIRDEHFPAS